MLRQRISRAEASQLASRRWDATAEDWDRFVEQGFDRHRLLLHGPALLRLVGPVRGRKVLDLGCGQGYFSRVLARRGAMVSAIDWSPKLLAMARERERRSPLGIHYVLGDAVRVDRAFRGERFDLAVGCMSLMDMTRPDQVLRSVAHVLAPDGRLVFSISHPFSDAVTSWWSDPTPGRHGPRVYDHYFDEGPATLEWRLRGTEGSMRAPQWHRTLTSWSRYLREAGLAITALDEPRPSAALARKERKFEGARRVPLFLNIEARPLPPVRWTRNSVRPGAQPRSSASGRGSRSFRMR